MMVRTDASSDDTLSTLLVIGTSTGGPQALTKLFQALPLMQGTTCCVVQHMPAGFTANLAKRLDQVSEWHVREAKNGETLQSGVAYIAPGGFQTSVVLHLGRLQFIVEQSGAVSGHQPSVDVLFESAVRNWTGPTIGVLMTGMGRDGARGLKLIRDCGGYTISEDESTCVVYGMPKAAVGLNASMVALPLGRIPEGVVEGWSRLQGKRIVHG